MVWCGGVWWGGARSGMHFSQSKDALLLNLIIRDRRKFEITANLWIPLFELHFNNENIQNKTNCFLHLFPNVVATDVVVATFIVTFTLLATVLFNYSFVSFNWFLIRDATDEYFKIFWSKDKENGRPMYLWPWSQNSSLSFLKQLYLRGQIEEPKDELKFERRCIFKSQTPKDDN